MIIAYTDGSCLQNTNNGGYGCVIFPNGNVGKEDRIEISGSVKNTTNNRMELRAVIEVLAYFGKNCDILVYSDSMYVINCAKGVWKRKKNKDLWKKYDKNIIGKNINFIWVKGHSDNFWNNRADHLATSKSKSI